MREKIATTFDNGHRNKAIPCPRCGLAKSDWSKDSDTLHSCGGCGFIATLHEWQSRFRSGRRVGCPDNRPASRSVLKYQEGRVIVWEVPCPRRSGGILFFAWLWSIFTGALTFAGIYGAMVGQANTASLQDTVLSYLILFLFWAIGLGALYSGYRARNSRHRITIDRGILTIEQKWRHRRSQTIFSSLEPIDVEEVLLNEHNTSVDVIAINSPSHQVWFGNGLSSEERAWLVADLRYAISQQAVRQPLNAHPPQRLAFSRVIPESRVRVPKVLQRVFIGVAVLGCLSILRNDRSLATVAEVVPMGLIGFVLLSEVARLVIFLQRRGIERRLEVDNGLLSIRDTRKNETLQEQVFQKALYHDIRISSPDQWGRGAKSDIDLLIDGKAEKLAWGVDKKKAEEFTREVRQAMDHPGSSE